MTKLTTTTTTTTATTTLPLAVCGASDTGLVRDQNEDAFVIADLQSGELSHPCARADVSVSRNGVLLLVCDGMGGAAAGEIAAHLAADSIKGTLIDAGPKVKRHPGQALEQAVEGANQAIRAEANAHPEERGMGTTCTAAVVLPDTLVVAQVGDSRAYLLRAGELSALTHDQSVVAKLLASGALRPDEAAESPLRHVLLQALGTSASIEPEITQAALRPGDRILICSDGLHGPVPEPRIAAILRDTPDIARAAQGLIQAALSAGGPDNVTVVVADCGPAQSQ